MKTPSGVAPPPPVLGLCDQWRVLLWPNPGNYFVCRVRSEGSIIMSLSIIFIDLGSKIDAWDPKVVLAWFSVWDRDTWDPEGLLFQATFSTFVDRTIMILGWFFRVVFWGFQEAWFFDEKSWLFEICWFTWVRESITFEGQMSIRRVSGTVKMKRMRSLRLSKWISEDT